MLPIPAQMDYLCVRSFVSLADVVTHRINTFEWVAGVTPLSELSTPIIAVVCYLSGIFGLRQVMKSREPIKCQTLLAAHNLSLSFVSLVMFVAVVWNMLPRLLEYGFTESVCNSQGTLSRQGPLHFWFYIFYLSKIYEFLDTVFIVLRKKSLQFLHVYHHVTTLWLCWLGMTENTPYQWIDIVLNTFVHVVMYYYYYLSDQGVIVWWKKIITRLQITQFVVDISVHLQWLWIYYAYSTSTKPACSGSPAVWFISNGVLGSFLLLFIRFYRQAYQQRQQQRRAKSQ